MCLTGCIIDGDGGEVPQVDRAAGLAFTRAEEVWYGVRFWRRVQYLRLFFLLARGLPLWRFDGGHGCSLDIEAPRYSDVVTGVGWCWRLYYCSRHGGC
jgi:hypothetical protein